MISLFEKILTKLMPQGPGELPAAKPPEKAATQTAAAVQSAIPKKPLTYGIGPGFEVCASYPAPIFEEHGGKKVPAGVTFRVSYHGSSAPITLRGDFTEADIPEVMAVIASKLSEGKNLVEVGQTIEQAVLATPRRIELRFKP